MPEAPSQGAPPDQGEASNPGKHRAQAAGCAAALLSPGPLGVVVFESHGGLERDLWPSRYPCGRLPRYGGAARGLMAAEGRGEGPGPRAVGALALRCYAVGMGSFGGGECCRGLSGIAQFRIAVVTGDGLRTPRK